MFVGQHGSWNRKPQSGYDVIFVPFSDGKPSDCTLLFNPRDRRLQEFFIRTSFPDRGEIEAVYDALWDSQFRRYDNLELRTENHNDDKYNRCGG